MSQRRYRRVDLELPNINSQESCRIEPNATHEAACTQPVDIQTTKHVETHPQRLNTPSEAIPSEHSTPLHPLPPEPNPMPSTHRYVTYVCMPKANPSNPQAKPSEEKQSRAKDRIMIGATSSPCARECALEIDEFVL